MTISLTFCVQMCRRLRKIDELVLSQHYYLGSHDDCYYLMEYLPNQYPEDNNVTALIHNLKKYVSLKGQPEYRLKDRAINFVVKLFRSIFYADYLNGDVSLVPIPPSKDKTHAEYDDRMVQIIKGICEGSNADVSELIILTKNIGSSHRTVNRPPPSELKRVLTIDGTLCAREPSLILLFDDMIVTGTHFVACKQLLQERFPNARIVGVFITRRIIRR